MTLGCFCGTYVEAPKKLSCRPICSFWRPKALKSHPWEVPKGGPHRVQIITKSSPSRCGHPTAPFELKKWSPEGDTPQKAPQSSKKSTHDADNKKHELNRYRNAAPRDRKSLRYGGGSGRRPYRICIYVALFVRHICKQ